MKMVTRLDLKPNPSLLDPKFESYRLSLDSLPVLKQNLLEGIQDVELGEDRYGYLEVYISAFLNHLYQDPWTPECLFFVNETHHICWISLLQDGRLAERKIVWQLPAGSGYPSANTTLSLPGTEWAVVCNGGGELYTLNTPSRTQGEPWQLCFTYQVDGASPPTYLLSSTYSNFPTRHQIDCIMAHISPPQNIQGSLKLADTNISNVLVLEWLTFSCATGNETGSWNLKRSRRLVSTCAPHYTAVEAGGSYLCLAAEKEFSLIFDSRRQEEKQKVEEQKSTELPPLYTYIQSIDDITVIFRLPENINKSDIKVVLASQCMEVQVKGKKVIEGELCHLINTDGSTWIIDGDKLEITLSKLKSGIVWAELVRGDTRGEELVDPAMIEEMHNRLAHLTSAAGGPDEKPPYNAQQLEECDVSNEFFVFTRMDGESHRTTHHINLGGRQWLFNITFSPESLPVMCLRYDVDGLVWQPKNTISEGEDEHFKMEHIATFPALGYVLASKQDRKFVTCSPDFHFAAVSDSFRHVYIYRQPENLHSSLELRNRRTGKEVSRIAKQHVVNLEDCSRILGLCATKNCIFVLSKKSLYCIKTTES